MPLAGRQLSDRTQHNRGRRAEHGPFDHQPVAAARSHVRVENDGAAAKEVAGQGQRAVPIVIVSDLESSGDDQCGRRQRVAALAEGNRGARAYRNRLPASQLRPEQCAGDIVEREGVGDSGASLETVDAAEVGIVERQIPRIVR